MGACSSCLGRHDDDDYDENEESRLFDDDTGMYPYGSFGEADETLEEQRELDDLHDVMAHVSNTMFDVYENESDLAAQEDSYSDIQDSSRFYCLVQRLGATDEAPVVDIDWEDENEGARGNLVKVVNHNDAFVGAFESVAAPDE